MAGRRRRQTAPRRRRRTLPEARARERASAADLQEAKRAQWRIEHSGHRVRDVVLGEDACLIRSGAAPQARAACRNLVLARVRRAGYGGIAAVLRTLPARPAPSSSSRRLG